MENYYVAIDLGSSKITGVVAQKTAQGKLRLVAVEETDSRGHVSIGKIDNVEMTAGLIREIISKLQNHPSLRAEKLHINRVNVGLGGHTLKTFTNYVNRQLDSHETVTSALLQEMFDENYSMETKNHEIYDVVEQEYFADNDVETNPIGVQCCNLQGIYKLICGKPELRQGIADSMERIQMKISGMYLSPVAVSEAALSLEDKANGCALIDFGAETTSVCMYYQGYLRYVLVVPFGGNLITNNIKEHFEITHDKAERLKIKHGSAVTIPVEEDVTIKFKNSEQKVSTLELSELIETVLSHPILEFICQGLEQSRFSSTLNNGIVITGRASQLKNLDVLINRKTGREVRVADPGRWIDGETVEKYKDFDNLHILGLLLLAHENCAEPPQEEIKPEPAVVDVKEKKKKSKGDNTPNLFNKFGSFAVSFFSAQEDSEKM